jgi:hypothetical protein
MGRLAGIALFWALACYVVGMSAVSIIPSLFWPELGPRPEGPGVERCAKQIDALDHELLNLAADALRTPRQTSRWPALKAWDQRFAALSDGCGALEGARRDLLRLRTGVESLLRGYDRGPMRTRERIRRALEQFEKRAGITHSKG